MKIAGTVEDFLKFINEARKPIQTAGSLGPVALGALASGALKASAPALSSKRDEKKLRRIIRQEATKAIKARQGLGLSFDLFG
jgi:hypothetical protein